MKKVLIFMLFFISIFSILMGSVAYYRIVVNGSITGSTGNAVFVVRDTVDGESWSNKVIDLGKINPGDSGSFDVIMDVTGSSVDMYATLEIIKNDLPTNLKFYTTKDHKSELHKYYSFLDKNGVNKELVTIYWYWNPSINDDEDNRFINKSFSATISLTAIQISDYATMKNGYSVLNGGSEFWNNNYRPYIRTITFGNDLSNLPSSCNEDNLCWNLSENENQNKKVYGYLIDSGLKDATDNTKSLYNLYIVSDAPIFAPSNSSYLFFNFNNLIGVKFNNFNTSNVTDMQRMFYSCTELKSLDLSSFNTAKVTNMEGMFGFDESLVDLDISNFNTANVTLINSMFTSCYSLVSIDLSSFNTANVTNMMFLFNDCLSLTSLDVTSFDTTNVTNMQSMFNDLVLITSLDVSKFNTAKVTNMSKMFCDCKKLVDLDVSKFDTKNVTNISMMFSNCNLLTDLNLNGFNSSNIIYWTSAFENCYKLSSTINVMNLDISDENNYLNAFRNTATDSNARVVVNYLSSVSSSIDTLIATKSSNSNVVKGIKL